MADVWSVQEGDTPSWSIQRGVPHLVHPEGGGYAGWSIQRGVPQLVHPEGEVPCLVHPGGGGTPAGPSRGGSQMHHGKVTCDPPMHHGIRSHRTPPPELNRLTDRQTLVKTLPSRILSMRAVMNMSGQGCASPFCQN